MSLLQIVDEIIETIDYLRTKNDDVKVYVDKRGYWRRTRWMKLKRNNLARFWYPKDWDNYVNPKSVFLVDEDAFITGGVAGIKLNKLAGRAF